MEEPKKKSSVGIVILIIIFLLAGLAGGYYISDSNILNLKKETKKEVKKENKQVTEEKVEKDAIKVIEKRIDVINGMAEYFPINDVSEIPNQELLGIGMPPFTSGETATTYSQSMVENEIYFIIGDNAKFTHENYLCEYDKQPFFTYDAANKSYVTNTNHPGHGGSGLRTYKVFDSATSKGDILKVNYKNVYTPLGDVTPVATLYDAAKDGNKLLEDVPWNEVESKCESLKDKLPITTYTFEKTKYDGYNLKSVTIKK